MQYRINLEAFEGPMDLLLYLIKKNDLNIYDIPIAFVTDEYLKYINSLKELNIDIASEFMEMAAELAYIKSKMLLPQEPTENEEPEEDPRADLVRRLIEYQRYKEAANQLNDRPLLYRDTFTANLENETSSEPREENIVLEGNAYLLLEAFNKMLAKMPKDSARKAPTVDRIKVNDRILQITEKIKYGQTIPFTELMPKEGLTKHMLVVTVLALLEMVIMKMIKIYQTMKYETIYVTGAMQEVPMEEGKEVPSLSREG